MSGRDHEQVWEVAREVSRLWGDADEPLLYVNRPEGPGGPTHYVFTGRRCVGAAGALVYACALLDAVRAGMGRADAIARACAAYDACRVKGERGVDLAELAAGAVRAGEADQAIADVMDVIARHANGPDMPVIRPCELRRAIGARLIGRVAPLRSVPDHDCLNETDGLVPDAVTGASVAWHCRYCGRPWVRLGAEYVPAEGDPYEPRVEEVRHACPCACNSGGSCGGCGHAGCGGRR